MRSTMDRWDWHPGGLVFSEQLSGFLALFLEASCRIERHGSPIAPDEVKAAGFPKGGPEDNE